MLRAMIGTLAVLAGFGVLERSLEAGTGHTVSCAAGRAYVLLQPGETVPVHREPSLQAAVVAVLSDGSGRRPGAAEVTLTGSQGGWARLALETATAGADGGAAPGFGWVPADLLTVDARVDGTIEVYDRPGLLGGRVGAIEDGDARFRVLGCRGSRLQVVNARLGAGWIDRWCGRVEGCRP